MLRPFKRKSALTVNSTQDFPQFILCVDIPITNIVWIWIRTLIERKKIVSSVCLTTVLFWNGRNKYRKMYFFENRVSIMLTLIKNYITIKIPKISLISLQNTWAKIYFLKMKIFLTSDNLYFINYVYNYSNYTK